MQMIQKIVNPLGQIIDLIFILCNEKIKLLKFSPDLFVRKGIKLQDK